MNACRTLIVGIGSPHGDDQAGWRVAEALAVRLQRSDVFIRQALSPSDLLNWLDGVDRLIIVDACRGLGTVGEVRCWVWPTDELLAAAWSGTHDVSLPNTLQLADRLARLPQDVVIWSVAGALGEPLNSMSSRVAAAVPQLAETIARELVQEASCTNVRS